MKFIYSFIFLLILPPIGAFFWFSIYGIFKSRNESEIDPQSLRWLRNSLLCALVGALWVVMAPSSCADSGDYEKYERWRN
jgi:hypothetical protein